MSGMIVGSLGLDDDSTLRCFMQQGCSLDLKPGDCELVVDEGRALQPCRYRLFTHMSCIIIYPYSTYPCRGYFHTQ